MIVPGGGPFGAGRGEDGEEPGGTGQYL
jgi:hypothetical protein